MTITLANVLSMAIVVAVQSIHCNGIRPDTAHLEEQTSALMNPFRRLRVRHQKRADIQGILVLARALSAGTFLRVDWVTGRSLALLVMH